MGLGARRGLGPGRQRELAAAAYAESGLNPRAVNPSSGAAGFFQLLSPGYRQQAQKLGGLFNPKANTLAILNDYTRYWQQNPQAAPGAAGRDVERSGMGAEFYARPLAQIPGGGVPGFQTLPQRAGAGIPSLQTLPQRTAGVGTPSPVPGPGIVPLVARQLLSGRGINLLSLVRQLQAQRVATAEKQPPAALPAARLPEGAGPAAGVPTGAGPALTGEGYAMPARGKIIGTPGVGTHTLGNWESDRALDISVPVGTPVYSPFGGTIGSQFGSLGAGPSSRFGGLRLHVASPENEWYAAHLSRFAPGIRPGVRVKRGQVVGYSGVAAGVPHLHEGLERGDPYWLVR